MSPERADLTIIDFCDAMAQRYLSVLRGGVRYMSAIRQAHDIAHVLEGGPRTLSWHTVTGLCGPQQVEQDFGPAWPDVRLRMADVLARAEEMTR